MSGTIHVASVAGAAMLAVAASSAKAGADLVQLPESHQDSFTHYATINRDVERKQVVQVFANDVALARAKDGAPLDNGSVIVMEAYKVTLGADEKPVVGADGLFEPDALGFIAVMESRDGWGADYPDEWQNGSWEYAGVKGDDQSFIERDYQPCFECHEPLHDAGYVFSLDALTKAAGG